MYQHKGEYLVKSKPVSLGESYEIEITGLSHQGEGIGRVNNFAVFIPGAIPQEKVKVKIKELKKNLARAELEKIITPAPSRVKIACPWANMCGGCDLQHISYEQQLELKRKMVSDTLTKLGDINLPVLPVLGMDYPWRYRNKGNFHVAEIKGEIQLGFYKPGSYELVPARESLLFSSVVNKLVSYLEEKLTFHDVKAYNPRTGQGYLINILIRESKATGEIMLVFITSEKQWKLELILDSIQGVFPQVVSIYHNVNKNPRTILGRYFNLLRGQAFIKDTIGSLVFKISPESFFQVNNLQTEVLYAKTLDFAALTGRETVLDAYCGIGTISLFLAEKAEKVIGIEVIAGAIKDAQENAKLNGINNTEFIVDKVENWLPQWVKEGGKADVIVVDPPRKGCAPETLEAIVEVEPERVVYVSCNPATLTRDLKYLVEHGYEVKEVQPVDMFPQTSHVECIVLIKRAESRVK